jgi:hypothetical protein
MEPCFSHRLASRHRLYSAIVFTLAAFFVCPFVFGQTGGTAGLYGSVYDPQGAMAPGSQVTLTNVDTQRTEMTETGPSGSFIFQFLPVGHYELIVTKGGFQKYVQSGITLQVNDNPKIEVRLSVGRVESAVTVESATPLVQTQGADVKMVVDSRRIVDLPLNGRNLSDLALLSPGTVSVSEGDGVKTALGTRQFSINGARNNETRYTLDGGDNNDTMYNSGMPFPFPDAVQEFSVVTSGKGADVGSSPGGTVNIVTRSGTNEFHGDAFWFVRNTVFNANNFFSQTGDQLKRNQGGFTAGGPVIKNKLFLFGGWQRTWVRQQIGSNTVQAMPEAYRHGDYSDLLKGGDPLQLVDPTSNQPYANNQIPQYQLSPAMQNVLSYWPIPGPDGLVVIPVTANTDIAQYVIRGDYVANEHNSIFARYLTQRAESPRPLLGKNFATSQDGSQMYSQSATLGWTASLTPNLISDAHVFMNYAPGLRTLDAPWGSIKNFGVNINPLSTELDVGLDGASGFGLGSDSRGADFRRASVGFGNSWHLVTGRHNISFGGEMRWSRYNEYNPYHSSGVFKFDGRCTGFDQADAIIGCLSQFTQGNGEFEFRRQHYQALFVGDSIRITPRITLDAGLRWEPFTPITDLRNRNVLYDQASYEAGVQSEIWLQSPPGLLYPGDTYNGSKLPQGISENDWNLFAPRVGLAWDPLGDGTLSIRSGVGVYHSLPEIYLLNALSDQAPWGYDQNFQGGYFDDPYGGRESANVFPLSPSFLSNPNMPFPSPVFAYGQERKFDQATTYAWNLVVEKQFRQNWMLHVAYIGNSTSHLVYSSDINAPIYNFNMSLRDNQNTMQERRPRSQYERLYVLGTGQNANYNGLQVYLQHRFARNFSLTASYTWSKSIDYNSNNGSVEEMNGGDSGGNPFNPLYFRGRSNYDRTHVFVGSFLWEIPGIGERGSFISGLTRHWNATGILTAETGLPFTITASSSQAACNDCSPHADQIGPLTFDESRSKAQWLEEYFNTANVIAGAPGTFGNIGRNTVTGPGFANVDFSIYREFPIPLRESMKAQFRAEAFNLFNHTNFANPESQYGNSTFGRITSTSGDPRIMQFAVKFYF